MTKEQLEELIIKRNEDRGLNKFEIDWVVKYAREQYERVQELEQSNDNLHKRLQQNGSKYKRETNLIQQKHTNEKDWYTKQAIDAHGKWGILRLRYEKLQQQNKRYREALEFYANEKNNKNRIDLTVREFEYMSKVVKDGGERARKALEDENE